MEPNDIPIKYSIDEIVTLTIAYVCLFLIFSRVWDLWKSLCELYSDNQFCGWKRQHSNWWIILTTKSFVDFIALWWPIISWILTLKIVQPLTNWIRLRHWLWKFIISIILIFICWGIWKIIDFNKKTNDANTIANPPSILNKQ